MHFQKDPILKNYVILRPEWGTTAVYKALDNQAVRDNLGRFSRDQLDTIWSDSEYAGMQDELLQLMMRFKLCYLIPGTEGQYIAPQLLAVDSPIFDWDERDNLVLRYHYNFMPKGILTRFIVEMHRFIEEQRLVWKTGVVLTNGSARAEVIELYHKSEIHIRISGTLPIDLLSVITHEIDQINDSYERIQVDKQIPCNCSLCITGKSLTHFFPLDILQRSLEQTAAVQCPKSFQMVDSRQLIYGIGDYIIDHQEPDSFTVTNPANVNRGFEAKKETWPIQRMDPVKRLKLFKTLSGLAAPSFEELVFALSAPYGDLDSGSTTQGERVFKLIEWSESSIGCGLGTLEAVLNEVLKDA